MSISSELEIYEEILRGALAVLNLPNDIDRLWKLNAQPLSPGEISQLPKVPPSWKRLGFHTRQASNCVAARALQALAHAKEALSRNDLELAFQAALRFGFELGQLEREKVSTSREGGSARPRSRLFDITREAFKACQADPKNKGTMPTARQVISYMKGAKLSKSGRLILWRDHERSRKTAMSTFLQRDFPRWKKEFLRQPQTRVNLVAELAAWEKKHPFKAEK